MRVEVAKDHSRITFKVYSDSPISEGMAREIQRAHGFIPMGYGFYSFCLLIENGVYIARWTCSNSCE